jgi:hypothetical protein
MGLGQITDSNPEIVAFHRTRQQFKTDTGLTWPSPTGPSIIAGRAPKLLPGEPDTIQLRMLAPTFGLSRHSELINNAAVDHIERTPLETARPILKEIAIENRWFEEIFPKPVYLNQIHPQFGQVTELHRNSVSFFSPNTNTYFAFSPKPNVTPHKPHIIELKKFSPTSQSCSRKRFVSTIRNAPSKKSRPCPQSLKYRKSRAYLQDRPIILCGIFDTSMHQISKT